MQRQALWDHLKRIYEERTPGSRGHFEEAVAHQVRGGSHNLRLFEPYPFYDVESSGSRVTDLDGNRYVDFWQGHYGNILGHNPAVIRDVLVREFQHGRGLHTGFPGTLQAEFAAELCRSTGHERIRFTTSGALATLYAVMLSRGFTNRRLTLKVGGGWHGSQPYLLKGITAYAEGLKSEESAGLHLSFQDETMTTRFNDLEGLERIFQEWGDRLACFILEPFIGEGGFLLKSPAYLRRARKLCDEHGVVLVFDEIISGFRFHAGPLSALFGVQPDLTTLGKIVGGGMPITALAGKSAIMELCDPAAGSRRVRFEGGTFSAHPAAMLAGLTMVRYLRAHQEEIYPQINRLGERVRREVPKVFEGCGIPCVCTGHPNEAVPGSSMAMIQFPLKGQKAINTPDENWNPEVCDFEMREKILRLALANHGFHTVHGFGALSTAHTDGDVDSLLNALEEVAKTIRRFS